MALYIKSFYTNKELGLRFAAFWSSNAIAGCLSGPLALGLLALDGRHGLRGWQWLFLIEGVLTCFLAVIAFLYLPHSATTPKVFFGRRFSVFTPHQATILTMRTLRDDPGKSHGYHSTVKLVDIKDTFLDWKVCGHVVTAFLSM
jgi:MFS family permease